MVGMTLGIEKTNRFPNLIHEQQRLDWQLVLRKPTAFQPSYLKAHVWNDGWIDDNQPFSNPHTWAATVGLTVGFAKTKRDPTFVYLSQRFERRLVLRKPTPFQLSYLEVYGWNDGWYCENQPHSILRLLKPLVGMAVDFAKTNPVPTFVYNSLCLEWRLVLRKPTPFQPSYLKVHGWNDGWFCEYQPLSNLLTLKHMVGMTVGLTKINGFRNLIHERQCLDRQLDSRKPTAFQHSYIQAKGWNDGWFCENQLRSNFRILKSTVGMTIGLTKTNRFPTLIHEPQRLDWQLDLREPTAFQPSYLKAHGWSDGWIHDNQPFSKPHTWAATVGSTAGFAITKRIPTFVYLSERWEWRLVLRKATPFQLSYLEVHGWMTVGFAKTNRVPTFGY